MAENYGVSFRTSNGRTVRETGATRQARYRQNAQARRIANAAGRTPGQVAAGSYTM